MDVTPSRSAGMSLHFAVVAIFGVAGVVFLLVAIGMPSPWWIAACVATLGPAVWAYVQTLRRDPWHAAIFALLSALAVGIIMWPLACTVRTGSTRVLDSIAILLASVTALSAGYVVWRRFGRERAPDFLHGGDVFEIDGVALRWAPEFFGSAGGVVVVEVQLQNAYDAVLTVDLRLIPSPGARRRVVPAPAHLRLEPGEYGVARVRVGLAVDARGRIPLRIELRTRRARLLPRRLRLRPKRTLTVGLVELMSVLGAIAGEFRSYAACCVDVIASPSASAAPQTSAAVQWERRWIPDA